MLLCFFLNKYVSLFFSNLVCFLVYTEIGYHNLVCFFVGLESICFFDLAELIFFVLPRIGMLLC